jgi:hypothetical protein
LEAFRGELAQASATGVEAFRGAVLGVIAYRRMGDRPDRVEPRVVKRRPKAYPRMQESRRQGEGVY